MIRNTCCKLRCCQILSFSLIILGIIIGLESSEKELEIWEIKNRDGEVPKFPLEPDLRVQSSNIANAHEILRKALQQFLGFNNADLGTYLNYLIKNRTEPFSNEYGKVIRVYKKVFLFILEQYNETLVQNYAINQFEKDKLDLCSVGRYLSHQPNVEDRQNLMKRMGDALEYRCHPCTPYRPKQFSETVVPDVSGIDLDKVSPEEILVLCKEYQDQDQGILPPTSTTESSDLTENVINPFWNYSPCTYSNERVVCNSTSIGNVKKAFAMDAIPVLASIKLSFLPRISVGITIPGDILTSSKTTDLLVQFLNGSIPNGSLKLQVDPNAFRSTKNYTKYFQMDTIECRLLDLKFLSGFNQLTKLTFTNIYEIQHCLPSLPSLPSLTSLNISFCTGMNEISAFPPLINGLEEILFRGSENDPNRSFNDETVDRVMDWILPSSAETLEAMKLVMMKLVTQVPRHIASFKALGRLWLHNNGIKKIKKGALSFSSPAIFILNMAENGLEEIEPDSFQGNFRDARFNIEGNNLTRFDKLVFGSVVKQQRKSLTGFINALKNPIVCIHSSEEIVCHLAWLKEVISSGEWSGFLRVGIDCNNGKRLTNLQTAIFDECPNSEGISDETSPTATPVIKSFGYSPCTDSNGHVLCNEVSLDQVQRVLRLATTPTFNSIHLILGRYIDNFIPEDILADKGAATLIIEYPEKSILNDSAKLQVHINAFQSTKDHTKTFILDYLDCSLLDLSFLSGFDQLTVITIMNIKGIQFCLPTLPSLPSLTELSILYCRGINEIASFPKLVNGLEIFKLYGNKNRPEMVFNDETADRLMDWLHLSSTNTLKSLKITDSKQLTKLPHMISSFKSLDKVEVTNSSISNIKTGEFVFYSPVSKLNIWGNIIEKIEPGAFQGNFKNAIVNLTNNNLTRFDESVFGIILQQMASGDGIIYASENPIDCSKDSICHLIWLKRYDFNDDITAKKIDLKCSNGTSFNDLNSVGFNHCQEYASLDYAPCHFSEGRVTCQSVSILKVQKIFRQTVRSSLDEIELTLNSIDKFIPRDVFSDKKTTNVIIQHTETTRLEVDENAFRSTKTHTKKLILNKIECSLMNLIFLSGFENLENLTFANIGNIHNCLPTLPPLPNLIKLEMDNCVGMHQLNNFPSLINGLKSVVLFGHENYFDELWDDETISKIMDWILKYSQFTLEELQFQDLKRMTKVPHQISSFKQIDRIRISNTNISSITAGTFVHDEQYVYPPFSVLSIEASGLKEIEPGAIQGDYYRNSQIELNDNSLVRFDESVFGPILTQMAFGKGSVNATGNPIDCSEENLCNLSWLRRFKAGSVFHLNCANGTSFADLQSTGFNQCSS